MKYSREKKSQHFYSLFKEGESVLDVGVSSEKKEGLSTVNYFLKKYDFDPTTYTGLGVQDLSDVKSLYKEKRFVQYPGGRFPFFDNEFDWVFSNAVIEHVGDDDAQLLFLNEMMRVANNVFFTTPNKYFPVESHTNIVLLHWNDSIFYSWCKKNKPFMNRTNLYLFSFHRLRLLLKHSNASSFRIYKNRFLGIPMTFSITCTDI